MVDIASMAAQNSAMLDSMQQAQQATSNQNSGASLPTNANGGINVPNGDPIEYLKQEGNMDNLASIDSINVITTKPALADCIGTLEGVAGNQLGNLDSSSALEIKNLAVGDIDLRKISAAEHANLQKGGASFGNVGNMTSL